MSWVAEAAGHASSLHGWEPLHLHRQPPPQLHFPCSIPRPPLPVACCRHLDQCRFRGQLPAAWGQKGAFEELTNLTLANNALTATIPASWAYATSFPKLEELDLTANRVCGGVPTGLPVDTVCHGGTNNCVARPCDPAVLASPPPDAGGGNGEAAPLPHTWRARHLLLRT